MNLFSYLVSQVTRLRAFGPLLVIVTWSSAFAGLPAYDRVLVLDPPTLLSDVELIDTNGDTFALSRLHGKITFVFFGFTNCPDICPLTMQRLVELFETHKLDQSEITAVLISVDGERDQPEVMKSFLASYSPGFVGLTGDPKIVKKLAAQFRAPFFKGNSAGMEAGGYTVAHSPQVYLLDAKGALRAEFYNASIDAMAGTAKAVIEEQRAAGAIGKPGGG